MDHNIHTSMLHIILVPHPAPDISKTCSQSTTIPLRFKLENVHLNFNKFVDVLTLGSIMK